MNYTKEQFDKLPKWAQIEIDRLTGNNKSMQKKVDELFNNADTNTFIQEGLDKKPLPKNCRIEFVTGLNKENTVSVYLSQDGHIDINTQSRGFDKTVILPRAANSFYIDFVK